MSCQVCSKAIANNESYMICEENHHFYHKKCLKNQYKQDYDEKLDAGYVYSSGTNTYKKCRCDCGCKLIVHNNIIHKMKKVGKVMLSIPLIAIVVVIL